MSVQVNAANSDLRTVINVTPFDFIPCTRRGVHGLTDVRALWRKTFYNL